MTLYLRALVALILVTTSVTLSAPAWAEPASRKGAAGSVSFPGLPSDAPSGWRGPIRMSGQTDAAYETLYIDVYGPDGYNWYDYWSRQTTGDGSFDFSVTTDAMTVAGTYRIEVSTANSGLLGQQTFTVAEEQVPAPEFKRADVNRPVFYPRVRDDYKDDVTVKYATVRESVVTLKVLDSTGRVVRSEDPRTFRPSWRGPRTWKWNGKSNRGNQLPTGRYRVKLTARAGGQEVSETMKVQIKSDVITQRSSDFWYGHEPDRLRGYNSCYAYTYGSRASLSCWDIYNATNDYAEAEYWFKIPKNARNLRWGMRGDYGCCTSPGRVVKTGKRVSPTRYIVKVRIDGFRAYDVFRATLSYTYKRRR